MFAVRKINEDTGDCPRIVAFEGASHDVSSSSYILGKLTKGIHGESDEFDEEEAQQAPRKDWRRRSPSYFELQTGFKITWNRPLHAVLLLLLLLLGGGGGGAGVGLKNELLARVDTRDVVIVA